VDPSDDRWELFGSRPQRCCFVFLLSRCTVKFDQIACCFKLAGRRVHRLRAREFLLVLLLLPSATLAHGVYERPAFDNSLSYRSFYYSEGTSVSPSELELIDSKIPTDETHYVSPPNSLRLKWQSQTGGDWFVSLKVKARYGTADFSGTSLFFWCYSETDLSADESPVIYLKDVNDEGTPSIRLLGHLDSLPARKWVRVKLPFDSFAPEFEQVANKDKREDYKGDEIKG